MFFFKEAERIEVIEASHDPDEIEATLSPLTGETIGNQQVLRMAKRLTSPLNTARRRKHDSVVSAPQTW